MENELCENKFESKLQIGSIGFSSDIKEEKLKPSYHCDICGKSFSQSGALSKHKRERPYCCDICGKSFHQIDGLIVHKRIHTGENPYHCDICGKSFSDNGELTKHICIHTGDKPYCCDICGKSFSRNEHLTVHKQSIMWLAVDLAGISTARRLQTDHPASLENKSPTINYVVS
ncbi:endothelial zinc finger protein induced by tumor necrosis factor alpha-like [Octopus sinensis]|uniref:Endothelial zinc finger protein induced by tumor necrosis factor alpha-like n=1 Tax=Octopus sinensis TaxID=2607531 RepID=A0A6P7TMM6_9MOLL|nr:endothelial zinc finger protein induced by tumor necrosis factor alpha-like [Octopus sinensis]